MTDRHQRAEMYYKIHITLASIYDSSSLCDIHRDIIRQPLSEIIMHLLCLFRSSHLHNDMRNSTLASPQISIHHYSQIPRTLT